MWIRAVVLQMRQFILPPHPHMRKAHVTIHVGPLGGVNVASPVANSMITTFCELLVAPRSSEYSTRALLGEIRVTTWSIRIPRTQWRSTLEQPTRWVRAQLKEKIATQIHLHFDESNGLRKSPADREPHPSSVPETMEGSALY